MWATPRYSIAIRITTADCCYARDCCDHRRVRWWNPAAALSPRVWPARARRLRTAAALCASCSVCQKAIRECQADAPHSTPIARLYASLHTDSRRRRGHVLHSGLAFGLPTSPTRATRPRARTQPVHGGARTLHRKTTDTEMHDCYSLYSHRITALTDRHAGTRPRDTPPWTTSSPSCSRLSSTGYVSTCRLLHVRVA